MAHLLKTLTMSVFSGSLRKPHRIALFLISLTILGCQTTVVQKQSDYLFVTYPPSITKEDASRAVQAAGLAKGWEVKQAESGQLELKLERRYYKAELVFKFYDDAVRYSDLTTHKDPSTQLTLARLTPEKWINNLKKETNAIFRKILIRQPEEALSKGGDSLPKN